MDRAALREWIGKRPEIAEQLLRVLARRLRRTNNMLADLIFTDVPGRVAKSLLQLARQFGSQESGPAAGHPRPDPGGDRAAGRGQPGDGEQGARRLRAPRLAAAGGQERAHPGAGAAGPPGPLSRSETVRSVSFCRNKVVLPYQNVRSWSPCPLLVRCLPGRADAPRGPWCPCCPRRWAGCRSRCSGWPPCSTCSGRPARSRRPGWSRRGR